MDSSSPIVAIDGPAGAGKSSAARLLARRLGYVYIDSGAMYRAVALFARRRGISGDDGDRLAALAGELHFEFVPAEERPRLIVNGEDVSGEIRAPEISTGSSQVSQWPGVRAALVEQQRRLGARGGVVMEGRDIGTVVFPEAGVKIFLTASVEERARRRTEEHAARGEAVEPETILREVAERDRRDMEREHSPLRRAEDALEICTDGRSLSQIVSELEAIVEQKRRA
jgi:CMP/dCMP kinase